MSTGTTNDSRSLSGWMLAVVLLALVPRLAAAWMLRNTPAGPDALDDYLPMAESLVSGNGFLNAAGEPDSVRGPGYAAFLAIVRLAAGDSLLAIRVAQSLLDAATAALILSLGTRLWNRSVGILGSLLYAFHPLVIYSTSIIGPESLFAFLCMASGWFYFTSLGAARGLGFFSAGVLLALTTLSRATTMLLIVPWLVMIPSSVGKSRGWGNRLSLLVGFLLCCLPWTIRNAVVFHEFIPVAANAGTNFFAGSSREFFVPPPEHHVRRRERAEQLIALGDVPARGPKGGPGAGDRYNLELGLANYRRALSDDRAGLVRLVGLKLGMLWYATQSGTQQKPTLLVNAACGGAALVGLWIGICDAATRRVSLAIGLTLAYFIAVLSALYPLARYVIGFTPLLCLLAAVALAAIGRRSVGATSR